MKNIIKRMIVGSPLEPIVRKLILKPAIVFTNSPDYWEQRYSLSGNSGASSYGRLAEFKASVINKFVEENKINSVIEFGCGDGNQLSLAKYPRYIGIDVSQTAIKLCKQKFDKDTTKSFLTASDAKGVNAELSMSLDVIYHLIEDEIYNDYMTKLFISAKSYVCIYSSNYDDQFAEGASHVRHREFTRWVQKNAPEFQLVSEVKNIYPYDVSDRKNTSLADFFFFKRAD
jgi:protein O-GlcNAc transferase